MSALSIVKFIGYPPRDDKIIYVINSQLGERYFFIIVLIVRVITFIRNRHVDVAHANVFI